MQFFFLRSFVNNSTYKYENSRHIYECKLGLWEVNAPTKKQAKSEAIHYFQQYYSDCEYN
ncbi:hypothetical protein CXF74_19385 [Psychromonas sp. Urea-02u-13]|nr:hypothetical protein CXF74_19385 [Psychromonas sp. Urea-02u-13]